MCFPITFLQIDMKPVCPPCLLQRPSCFEFSPGMYCGGKAWQRSSKTFLQERTDLKMRNFTQISCVKFQMSNKSTTNKLSLVQSLRITVQLLIMLNFVDVFPHFFFRVPTTLVYSKLAGFCLRCYQWRSKGRLWGPRALGGT